MTGTDDVALRPALNLIGGLKVGQDGKVPACVVFVEQCYGDGVELCEN